MDGLLITTLIVASYHEYGMVETCGDRLDLDDFLVTYDDELVAHVDYEQKKDVLTIPDFITPIQYPSLYGDALRALAICKEVTDVLKGVYANSSEILGKTPLELNLFQSDAEINVKNTLICHVTEFFPPPVTISWTKNNLNVTDSATLSRYQPNKDGSMNVFSRLSFTPVEGDVYSCTVEHKALQQPQTRIWEVETKTTINVHSRVVFCGVGLGFGLLGLTAGVFFIIKGSNCN
ncbi:putative H-2 class II histocompatibility antigen [Triplophysa rosa]|uniref:H-2 class II histocompatibility antigen n=1 Tax=Triplophysa rosa TaxID=992332 RepID=A0A9W7WHP3_TRIRA|nr:putative H-2 class II histocompatibility antigen [Triplophysa rosa]